MQKFFSQEEKFNKRGGKSKVLSGNWYEERYWAEEAQKEEGVDNSKTFTSVMRRDVVFKDSDEARAHKVYFPRPSQRASVTVDREGNLQTFFDESEKPSRESYRGVQSAPYIVGRPSKKVDYSTVQKTDYSPKDVEVNRIGARTARRNQKFLEMALREEIKELRREQKQVANERKFTSKTKTVEKRPEKEVVIKSLYNEEPVHEWENYRVSYINKGEEIIQQERPFFKANPRQR